VTWTATIKIDGSCSRIDVIKPEDGSKTHVKVYKRYDTRDGNLPKGGGVPGGYKDDGRVDFYWIDVTDSTHPDDQYYQATLVRNENWEIMAINLVLPHENGTEVKIVAVPIEEIESGTYEIIGPKVQGNPYNLPVDVMTVVEVRKKKGIIGKSEVPVHYFVRHGIFEIKDFKSLYTVENFTLDSIIEYITSHDYEGIVFHFDDGSLMKVNRGHIGVEIEKEKGLKFI